MPGLLIVLNRLLPFATPGTPLVQDLLHLAALCLLLYYAPRIQESFQEQGDQQNASGSGVAEPGAGTNAQQDIREAHEERLEDDDLADNDPEADVVHPREQVDVEQVPQRDILDDGQPGPAHAPNAATQRNVGAKKAKSLARRDQRRAYHEFMRSQGEAQRARDAEGAAEREAALAAEKERRRATAAALDAKKAKEREERREREEQGRMEELKRRELAVSIVRDELAARNMSDLFKVAEQVGGDIDEDWVEAMLNAAGVIGRKGGTMTMVTSMGWVVEVTEEQMANLYIAAAEHRMGGEDGKVELNELGTVLETILRT